MLKPEQVSKDEWRAWVNLPATKWLIWVLSKKREAVGEWVLQAGADESTNFLYREIGQCISLLDSLEYITKTFDYLEKEEKEDESLGTSSPQDYS